MSLFGYVAPQSLDEAIAILAGNPQSRPLAGGHTLLLAANRSKVAGAVLVDLRKIDSLAGVELRPDGSLKIGATTTMAALAESAAVIQNVPVLAQTALLIGDAQVRNRATVAGNLAACEAGADLPPVLMALDAQIQLLSPQGSRELTADEFFGSAASSVIGHDELIVSLIIRAPQERFGAAYEKMKHSATLYALCGVAAGVRVSSDGTVSTARLAVTGAAANPERLSRLEENIIGRPANETSIVAAAQVTEPALNLITDLFASAEYRGHLTRVLAERALRRAIALATA